jgi:hypothetical protein
MPFPPEIADDTGAGCDGPFSPWYVKYNIAKKNGAGNPAPQGALLNTGGDPKVT